MVRFAERVSRDPTQSVVQSQRSEPSLDSGLDFDEPLSEIGAFHHDYIVRSFHHFSFDPSIEDFVVRRCGLAPSLYHPLWDVFTPSTVNGDGYCKLAGGDLQGQYIQDSFIEDGYLCYGTDAFGCTSSCCTYRLHNHDRLVGCARSFDLADDIKYPFFLVMKGCEFRLYWDPSRDRIGTAD